MYTRSKPNLDYIPLSKSLVVVQHITIVALRALLGLAIAIHIYIYSVYVRYFY